MAQSWRHAEPLQRRQLLFRVHEWIVDSALVDGVVRSNVDDDLGPGGPLATALAELVPTSETQAWRPWIRLVLHDLRRAFRWPASRRTEAWWRWLFLIPYRAPVLAPPRYVSNIRVPDGDQPA
jgi:hypothetical protein